MGSKKPRLPSKLMQDLRDILALNFDEQITRILVKQKGIISSDTLEKIPAGQLRAYLEKYEITVEIESEHRNCAERVSSFVEPSKGTGESDTNGEQNKPVGKTDK